MGKPLQHSISVPRGSPLWQVVQACAAASPRQPVPPNAQTILMWWLAQGNSADYLPLLEQVEHLTGEVKGYHFEVSGFLLFKMSRRKPEACQKYLAEWRWAIAAALVLVEQPIFFSPKWMTDAVVGVRDGIATERAFDRLPILADALEDAGCDNRDMLDHLREGKEHRYHCWVVDLLRVGGGTTL